LGLLRSTVQKVSILRGNDDPVIRDFILFQSGDDSAFWRIVLDLRIQKLIRTNVVKSTIQYSLKSIEVEDLNQQILLNIRDRIRTFQVREDFDAEHRVKSFFEFLKLVLIGERERAIKHQRGLISRSDESRYSTLKVKIEKNIDHDNELSITESEEKQESIKSKRIAHDFRKSIIKSFVETKNESFIRSFVSLIENDLGVADFFSKKESEIFERSAFTKRLAYYIYAIRKLFAEETDMAMKIKTLSIFTDHISIATSVFEDSNNISNWDLDYFTDRDLDTAEGKIGDLVRQHSFTFVLINSVDRENKANALVERYLSRRGIPFEKVDLDPIIASLSRFDALISKFNSIKIAKAWVLGMVKESQLRIARTAI